MIEDWQAGGFGVYIHWPFCEAKCPYCDFNSYARKNIDQNQWLDGYLKEIARYAELLPNRAINSVFFGGGTPSLMDPAIVEKMISSILSHWSASNDIEITLEANPTSVEADKFNAYSDAGVNRISMGVQALNDGDLKRLGRTHSVKEANQAFDIARRNFNRVSFDLIYARQSQTLEDWQKELRQALDMAVDHLSLYQLTIEQGTAFGDRYKRGKLRDLPDDDDAADMYQVTQDICAEAGLDAYEVSNYAKQGAQSRHNLIYWQYGDYVGIGPGAHGRVTLAGQRYATDTWKSPEKWLASAKQGNGDKHKTAIAPLDQAAEYLMMGLRIAEGIDLSRYAGLAGEPLDNEAITYLKDINMIELRENRLTASENGRPVLNSLIQELLPS
ncbi:MAG: radical SAM family heme chaperone HemW [Pseudomonadota bacterium]